MSENDEQNDRTQHIAHMPLQTTSRKGESTIRPGKEAPEKRVRPTNSREQHLEQDETAASSKARPTDEKANNDIQLKSIKPLDKTVSAIKIDEKSLPGTTVCAKG